MLDLEDFLDNDEDIVNTDDRDFNNPDEPEDDKDDSGKPEEEEEEEDKDPEFDLENDPRFDPKEEEDKETKDNKPDEEAAKPVVDTSLIETFLERYNILGGELETETGEKVFFKDLTVEQQLKVLGQVVDNTNAEVAGLNTEEKDLLKSVRESKLTVQEYMIKSAQEFSDMDAASQIFDVEGYKFETMTDDVIYSTYIITNNPDITDEVLEQEVEHAKKSPLYASTVNALRTSFISQREAQRTAYTDNLVATRVETAKKQSIKYVEAAVAVEEIAGWPVTKDVKNEILESFVELDAVGKSKFVKDIVENPELAFKAMWFLKHGEENFKKMDVYYKDQLKKFYNKGIEDGKSGKSVATQRQSGIKPTDKNERAPGGSAEKQTLEDFINSK